MKRIVCIVLFGIVMASCTPDEPDPTLSVEKKTFSLDNRAADISIKVITNCSSWGYDLGDALSWIDVKSTAGDILSLAVKENDTPANRRAVVTLTAPKSGSKQASANVVISQTALEAVLTFDSPLEFTVPAVSARKVIAVSTNLGSWDCSSEDEWITPVRNGDKMTVTFADNTVDAARTGSIMIYAPDGTSPAVSKTFKVTQEPGDVDYPKENLSESAKSNCYVVTHMGTYCFDATVRGNGKTVTGLKAPDPIPASGARLIWQSARGMVKSVSYDSDNSQIVFELSRTKGNAVIAATDASGAVVWSWHIWYPEQEIEGLKSDTGYEVMNMNLGALHNSSENVGSYGLLYQWGRKDPFPGSPVMSNGSLFTKNAQVYDIDGAEVEIKAGSMFDLKDNTLAYSIAHPEVCLSNNAQYEGGCRDWLTPSESNKSLWGNPDGAKGSEGKYRSEGSKTYYDPCPAGWRVPNISAFLNMTSTGGMIWMNEGKWCELFGEAALNARDINQDGKVNLDDYDNGWFLNMSLKDGTYSYFPATTRYDGQYALLMGSVVGLWGNYWYNCPMLNEDGSDASYGVGFSFGIADYNKNETITASAISNGSKADAYAVRCIRE